MRSKGTIRFLVYGEADYLPRNGDPSGAEQALAHEFAAKLGLKAQFVPVAGQDDLIAELTAGHGDVIVASFAITPSRVERIAFTRPIRFVDQLVVVRAPDVAIRVSTTSPARKLRSGPRALTRSRSSRCRQKA